MFLLLFLSPQISQNKKKKKQQKKNTTVSQFIEAGEERRDLSHPFVVFSLFVHQRVLDLNILLGTARGS